MIEVLIELATAAGGTLIGLAIGRRQSRTIPLPANANAPTCDCGHLLVVHEADGKTCNELIQVPHYLKSGARNGHEWRQCACTGYQGPKPIDTVFIPQS